MRALDFLVVGGPTVIFRYGGYRCISDPTFDPPTDYGILRKTGHPTITPNDVGHIDIAFVSHDDHKDNLDIRGRDFVRLADNIITTQPGAERLGAHAHGLSAGDTFTFDHLRVHAVPALHGPADGTTDDRGFVNCEVLGFVLETETSRLYISGDNTSLSNVEQVRAHYGKCDHAILHAGCARVPTKFDGRPLSMNAVQTAQAARILGVRQAIVVHQTQWEHFSEGPEETSAAFATAGLSNILDDTPLGQWGNWR
ncbi:MBL fold metallo-hydrolase [Arcanobacterium haemolyticum]|nr:MBL fold metallo-hydrolase [Arcanobacterium haemolyticum]